MSRALRSPVEAGSIAYSAVTQPLPRPASSAAPGRDRGGADHPGLADRDQRRAVGAGDETGLDRDRPDVGGSAVVAARGWHRASLSRERAARWRAPTGSDGLAVRAGRSGCRGQAPRHRRRARSRRRRWHRRSSTPCPRGARGSPRRRPRHPRRGGRARSRRWRGSDAPTRSPRRGSRTAPTNTRPKSRSRSPAVFAAAAGLPDSSAVALWRTRSSNATRATTTSTALPPTSACLRSDVAWRGSPDSGSSGIARHVPPGGCVPFRRANRRAAFGLAAHPSYERAGRVPFRHSGVLTNFTGPLTNVPCCGRSGPRRAAAGPPSGRANANMDRRLPSPACPRRDHVERRLR